MSWRKFGLLLWGSLRVSQDQWGRLFASAIHGGGKDGRVGTVKNLLHTNKDEPIVCVLAALHQMPGKRQALSWHARTLAILSSEQTRQHKRIEESYIEAMLAFRHCLSDDIKRHFRPCHFAVFALGPRIIFHVGVCFPSQDACTDAPDVVLP